LLLAASICVSAFAATDADPRLADSPITAKSLGDFEKPEPDDAHPHIENVKDADVVELPAPTKSNALPPGTVDVSPVVRVPQDIVPPTKTPSEQHVETRESSASIDTSLDENLIKERQKMAKEKAGASLQTAPRSLEKNTPKPLENVQAPPAPDVKLVVPAKPITEPGYASVLTGTLLVNTELNAETQPHLIRGVLIVPARVTLKINAGATIHLRSDVNAPKPLQTGVPDPSKGAAIWVYGTLLIAGDNGHPVEFAGQDKENANVLLYGAESSKIEGTRFKGTDVAQNGGVCQWINCEFNDSKYYALASGAGQFTHCSFKKCGGIFAAYEEGPWALLVRRCLFDNCRDGVLLNRDPGQACLLVERNNFIGTRGANLRAMPRAGATSSKNAEELLIGENWYGTTIEEDIDRRIVDRRTEPTIKAHLNTRPPSEKPYANTGAGAPQTSIANTLNDQQNASTKMLAALVAKQKALGDKSKIALEKTALNAKEIVKKDAKN
jgi:hypothetical protein